MLTARGCDMASSNGTLVAHLPWRNAPSGRAATDSLVQRDQLGSEAASDMAAVLGQKVVSSQAGCHRWHARQDAGSNSRAYWLCRWDRARPWSALAAPDAACIVLPRYAIARARLAVHWHDAKAAIFCYVFVPFYLNVYVRGGVGLYTSCCDFGVVLASV